MDQARLTGNQMVYDAVLRNLEIVGEAAKRIPHDVRQKRPHVERTKIAGTRVWLAHGYFHVNSDIVWDVVENRLPELEQAVPQFKDGGDG